MTVSLQMSRGLAPDAEASVLRFPLWGLPSNPLGSVSYHGHLQGHRQNPWSKAQPLRLRARSGAASSGSPGIGSELNSQVWPPEITDLYRAWPSVPLCGPSSLDVGHLGGALSWVREPESAESPSRGWQAAGADSTPRAQGGVRPSCRGRWAASPCLFLSERLLCPSGRDLSLDLLHRAAG